MKRIFLVSFIVASLVEIATPVSMQWPVHFISKPLIVISLLCYYLSAAEARSFTFVAGLLLCLAGDIGLLFQARDEMFFLVGLVAFLSGHIFYSITYLKARRSGRADALYNVQKFRLAFPIMLAGAGLVVFLYPTLGGLRVPVVLYSLVLIMMVLAALSRLGLTSEKSFWLVFAGALLFMLSDSILAINKFAIVVLNADRLIMLTYCSAQFLIVQGMVEGNLVPRSKST